MVKNPPASAGDTGSIPGLERSSGEGHGNPLHGGPSYSPLDHKKVRHDLATKQQHVSSNLLGCNSLLHLDHRLWLAFLFFPFDPLPFHFLLT